MSSLGKHPVIVGLQCGDEGKGKITDWFAESADWVIRFNGGCNAGHTLHYQGKKVVTHSVPSGILYPDKKNYIGAACLLNPISFIEEVKHIRESGFKVNKENLYIDHRAHVTLPFYLKIEQLVESSKGKIGSTKKGIGQSFMSKMLRKGIRVHQLFEADLSDRVHDVVSFFAPLIDDLDVDVELKSNLKTLLTFKELIADWVCHDTHLFYSESKSKKCLMEGAQGTLLDIDYGTYPYVTSSNTVSSFASVGAPFPMSQVGPVVGVTKAYLTRVGEGPFNSQIQDKDVAAALVVKGGEFGATTGRERGVGWLNLDELKLSCQLNDCKHVILTKADVLDGFSEFKVFQNGQYKDFPIWSTSLTDKNELSLELLNFVKYVEEYCEVNIVALGTGPGREEIFWRDQEFKNSFWN